MKEKKEYLYDPVLLFFFSSIGLERCFVIAFLLSHLDPGLAVIDTAQRGPGVLGGEGYRMRYAPRRLAQSPKWTTSGAPASVPLTERYL